LGLHRSLRRRVRGYGSLHDAITLFRISGINGEGGFGGFQAGANWQRGALVGGLEIDSRADIHRGGTSTFAFDGRLSAEVIRAGLSYRSTRPRRPGGDQRWLVLGETPCGGNSGRGGGSKAAGIELRIRQLK